jgi:hypothetical protein
VGEVWRSHDSESIAQPGGLVGLALLRDRGLTPPEGPAMNRRCVAGSYSDAGDYGTSVSNPRPVVDGAPFPHTLTYDGPMGGRPFGRVSAARPAVPPRE